MMNLNDLVTESHDRSCRKGFYDVTPTIPSRIALIHSEVSEALEDFRDDNMALAYLDNKKPVGFPSELADVVIRICDFAGFLQVRLDEDAGMLPPFETLEEALLQMHVQLSQAYVAWLTLRGEDEVNDVIASHLSVVVHQCYALASHLGVDLDFVIRTKGEFNETRPRMHGKRI